MKNQNEIFRNINDKNKNEQKYILVFIILLQITKIIQVALFSSRK